MRQQLGLLYQNFELVLYTHILGVLFQERTAHLRRCNLWPQFYQVNVRCCTVSGKGGGLQEDLRCHDSSSAIRLDPRLGKQEEIAVY
jgi:hypothetical protein